NIAARRRSIDQAEAALGGGKKLAASKLFQKALAGLQPGAHAVLYMDFARVGKGALAELDQGIQAEQKYAGSLPAEQKKARLADVARMQAVRKKFAALLAKFDVFGWSLRLEPRILASDMFLGALPAGKKLLQDAFPAGGPTAFHAALAGHSLWSGWLSLRLAGFLALLADLPDGSYRTLGDGLAEADKEFKQEMGLGLLKDVFGNLKEPMGFYFLSPDLSGLKADEPMQQQIMRLFKVACVARVNDAARLDQLIAKVAEKATAAGQAPEVVELDGAKLQVFRPEPGLVFALGRKGDAALLGFGQDALAELIRASVPGGLAGAAQGDLRGVGRVDVAAVSELLSSAVAKNIGGQEGMGFRMLWPMIQQVLGQVASLELEGRLPTGGLQARWTLNFR
ncbi:MAG TPA: hypothetical protein P5076_01745, partial [Myxococcota bacterium]|nr:hypothetical protein [Myxococcota bacterium]